MLSEKLMTTYTVGTAVWRDAMKGVKLTAHLPEGVGDYGVASKAGFLKDLAKASRKVSPQAKKRALKSR